MLQSGRFFIFNFHRNIRFKKLLNQKSDFYKLVCVNPIYLINKTKKSQKFIFDISFRFHQRHDYKNFGQLLLYKMFQFFEIFFEKLPVICLETVFTLRFLTFYWIIFPGKYYYVVYLRFFFQPSAYSNLFCFLT